MVDISVNVVKIPYAKLDIISIQFNFTTIAYAGSLKETQSHDRDKFISGNPQGEENPTKLPLYRCIKSTKIKPQACALSPYKYVSLSLSYVLYTSECVCSNKKHTFSIYTLSYTWIFS